jgi:hypothetical protein
VHRLIESELWKCLAPLVDACPFYESHPADCPLHLLQKLTGAQAEMLFNDLNEEDVLCFVHRCEVCSKVSTRKLTVNRALAGSVAQNGCYVGK